MQISLNAVFVSPTTHVQTSKIRTVHALLTLLFMLVSGPLCAYPGEATDEAFAALLSMPGAGPENGKWNFEVPEDLENGTEARLITYLEKKRRQGADFNAYRHFGTLLHHAIRANQIKVAVWLLANGADPRKTLLRGDDDAMSLSQRYNRISLVRLLHDKYAMTVPRAAPSPIHAANPMPASGPTKRRLARKSEADIAEARDVLYDASFAVTYSGNIPENAQKIGAAIEKWEVFAAQMTSDTYVKVLDDDDYMAKLVRLFVPAPEHLQPALARLPAAVVRRHVMAAIAGLAETSALSVARDKSAQMSYSIPANMWLALWRYIDEPIDYGGIPPLAGRIQSDLWPALVASGYSFRETELELGCMLTLMNVSDFKALWPQLEKYFPDIRQHAPNLVTSYYRLSTPSQNCWHGEVDDTIGKLRFLTSLGVRSPTTGINKGGRREIPDELLVAMAPFMPPQKPAAKARVIDRKPNCGFTMTDAWYRALLTDAVVTTVDDPSSRVIVGSVQLIEIPGQSECGLIVGGWERVETYTSGITDSFTGPTYESVPSCPDPTDRYEIWQQQEGRIVRLKTDLGGDDGDPYLIPVQDSLTGQHYYLHTGLQNTRCHSGGRLPFAFEWRRVKGTWVLLQTDESVELQRVLLEQCGADDGVLQCLGIGALTLGRSEADIFVEGKPVDLQDAFVPVARYDFIKMLRFDQFNAYQVAILSLDKPRLTALQADGIPGPWIAEALGHISDSSLPLAEKRQRTAWIFYDRKQLTRALASDIFVLDKLIEWLPREDWRPILDVLADMPGQYIPDSLRKRADEKAMKALACDFDHLRGFMCGETIEQE